MARSLDQISQDLSKLAVATAQMDADLKDLYKTYLAVLGKAVKQQLVLAVYHLCTQAYPDEFLALTVAQREKIQAKVRKIAAQGLAEIEQLSQVVELASTAGRLEGTDDGATPAQTDQAAIAPPTPDPEVASDAADGAAEPEAVDAAAAEPRSPAASGARMMLTSAPQDATDLLQHLTAALSLFAVLGADPLSPIILAKRHVLLERHLRAILQTLSSLTNYLLKQAHILPDLPEVVIAAASEADPGEPGPSTPNLLNVFVELGSNRPQSAAEDDDSDYADDQDDDGFDDEDDDESDREMTHLIAINLRLADIEFADARAALWRSKLQETLLKLKQLGSRYQKLQQEKARAEAEHAWRATWFEA